MRIGKLKSGTAPGVPTDQHRRPWPAKDLTGTLRVRAPRGAQGLTAHYLAQLVCACDSRQVSQWPCRPCQRWAAAQVSSLLQAQPKGRYCGHHEEKDPEKSGDKSSRKSRHDSGAHQ